jgi:hypothetical protein
MPRKPKPVYTIQAYDDITATAVYSCLKTLCEDWKLLDHYSTVYRAVRACGFYADGKVHVKRHTLKRSEYKRKN